MSFEELKRKANQGEIKLEELDIEDILKFLEEGFINPTLSENFHIPISEVKKIRRRKGLNDADFENLIRNMILWYDYVFDNSHISCEAFKELILMPSVYGFACALGKKNHYIKRCEEIDWEHMNPKEEIVLRKIDVSYRKKRYKDLFERMELILKGIELRNLSQYFDDTRYERKTIENKKFENKKVVAPKVQSKTSNVIVRNRTIAEKALKKAHYLCAWNINHETFIRKSNHLRYMESHHLIPLEFQKYFEYSLDIDANIICLCSQCHNEIHYGENYKEMVKRFYEERKEDLKRCGIELESVDDLYKMYEKEFDKENVYIES